MLTEEKTKQQARFLSQNDSISVTLAGVLAQLQTSAAELKSADKESTTPALDLTNDVLRRTVS